MRARSEEFFTSVRLVPVVLEPAEEARRILIQHCVCPLPLATPSGSCGPKKFPLGNFLLAIDQENFHGGRTFEAFRQSQGSPLSARVLMSPRQTRVLYIIVISTIGTLLGFMYARHRIVLSVANMKAQWGYVCDDGLSVPLYLFPPLGALAGMAVGVCAWPLFSRWLIGNADVEVR